MNIKLLLARNLKSLGHLLVILRGLVLDGEQEPEGEEPVHKDVEEPLYGGFRVLSIGVIFSRLILVK